MLHNNASINSISAHSLLGHYGAFACVASPGDWAFCNFIVARGLCISISRGNPRAFDMCFRKMDEFIGKDEAFVWPLTGLAVRD